MKYLIIACALALAGCEWNITLDPHKWTCTKTDRLIYGYYRGGQPDIRTVCVEWKHLSEVK